MLSLASLVLLMSNALAQTPLERGKYLVEGILTCGNCHTPRGPGGVLDTTRRHAGGPQVRETAEYRGHPSNITPDKETGIGAWSRGEIEAAIRDARRPNGQQLSAPMPSAYSKIFAQA